MRFKVGPEVQRLLMMFLAAARRMPMAKKPRAALGRVLIDLRTSTVNTHRFKFTYPFIEEAIRVMYRRCELTYRFRNIPRWQLWLLFPALFTYLFRVLPMKWRTMKHIKRVEDECKDLRGKCL